MGDTRSGDIPDLTPDETAVLNIMRQFRSSRANLRRRYKQEGAVEVQLVIQAFVVDHKVLGAYAFKRYEASVGEARDFHKHAGDPAWQLLQALVISNENPTDQEYGVEIGDCHAEVLG